MFNVLNYNFMNLLYEYGFKNNIIYITNKYKYKRNIYYYLYLYLLRFI